MGRGVAGLRTVNYHGNRVAYSARNLNQSIYFNVPLAC